MDSTDRRMPETWRPLTGHPLGMLGSDSVAYTRTLLRSGVRTSRIRSALDAGELARLRNGLVALPSTPLQVRRAARVGGRLAGASAARLHGLWVPDAPLTVAVPEHTGRLWDPDDPRAPFRGGVELIREATTVQRFGVSDPETMLAEVALTLPTAYAIAVGDSALRSTGLTPEHLLELDDRLPPRASGVLTRCDARAEAGTETVVRSMCQDVGLDPVPQSHIPLTYDDRSDLRIGDRLLIECDSRTHHGGDAQRLRDLRRDARLTALGYIVLRFDYRQIMFEPEMVMAAILRVVDQGLHLWR